jgi:hypothetical protein
MDDSSFAELVEYVKPHVAREHGIPAQYAHRLVGSTLSELHGDAKKLAREVGAHDPTERGTLSPWCAPRRTRPRPPAGCELAARHGSSRARRAPRGARSSTGSPRASPLPRGPATTLKTFAHGVHRARRHLSAGRPQTDAALTIDQARPTVG